MNILVFKTNLIDEGHVEQLKPSLDLHPGIIKWNVDLHDCDKVLRIVSPSLEAGEIESLVAGAGYQCEELI